MDKDSSSEGDLLSDLESGMYSAIEEQEGEKEKGELSRVWSGFVGTDGSIKGERAFKVENEEALSDNKIEEEKTGLLEQKIGVEKSKKKGLKKPPKPPRPPNSPPLDAIDQKLLKEIAESAMLKRARIERMKKKLKNTKTTHYNSSFWALIVTILFVLILIWQGIYSRGGYNVNFHGSPESSVHSMGRLISIQFHKNASRNIPLSSSSVSPDNFKSMDE